MYSNNEIATRKVYLTQHNQYLADRVMYERFLGMANDLQYYGLLPSDLRGKIVLDAGCGNSGYFQHAMINHGVKEMHCMDIGHEWISPLEIHLQHQLGKESLEKLFFSPGSTLRIPYPDNFFDVVFSNGVIMHLASIEEAKAAIKELSRVTKPGGKLFIYSGFNSGIGGKFVVPAFRNAYRSDLNFKEYIDGLEPTQIQSELYAALSQLREKKDIGLLEYLLIKRTIPKLIDLDLTRFFKNVLQVPNQQGSKLDSTFMRNELRQNSIHQISEVNFYVHRKNVRKYVAPIHFMSSLKISKLIYGGGHVRIVGTKKITQ
jgi:SAM-dependent methyltransferase